MMHVLKLHFWDFNLLLRAVIRMASRGVGRDNNAFVSNNVNINNGRKPNTRMRFVCCVCVGVWKSRIHIRDMSSSTPSTNYFQVVARAELRGRKVRTRQIDPSFFELESSLQTLQTQETGGLRWWRLWRVVFMTCLACFVVLLLLRRVIKHSRCYSRLCFSLIFNQPGENL